MDRQRNDAAGTTDFEQARTPPLDGILAYGAMVPIVLGVVGTYALAPNNAFLAQNLTLLWSGSVLLFLAGVRRGISFRTPGGARVSQLAAMLWLFALGFAALFAIVWGFPFLSSILELVGYISLAVLDPIAARREEAPAYFERLRPLQAIMAIVALACLAVRAGGYA